MKHYHTPYMDIVMIREDVICASGGIDGDVDMSQLFGPIFGNGNSGTGGGN